MWLVSLTGLSKEPAMNGTLGFPKVRSSTSRSPRIGIASGTSNSVNSEKVPGTFSVLNNSSLSPQASAQTEKKFLTPFSDLIFRSWS